MPTLINGAKIIVCVGSGGVGKTTLSASLAVYAAQQGLNALVLTIDPSRRLAQALGIDGYKSGEFLVPEQNYKGKLYAGLIDASMAFDEFVKESASDPQIAERLLKNSLYKQLSTSLSGSQEFTSLDKLYRASKNENYDLVILDTPPAQNAREFFAAPEKIYALFQKSITKWFVAAKEEQNVLTRVLNKGTSTVLKALEKITGSAFIGELSEFFNCIQGIQDQVSNRSIEVHRLLLDSSTHFVLVTGFDRIKLMEAHDILADLKKRGYCLTTVLLNRCFPEWYGEATVVADPELIDFHKKISDFHAHQGLNYDEFQKKLPAGLPLVKIPELDNDIGGVQDLQMVAEALAQNIEA